MAYLYFNSMHNKYRAVFSASMFREQYYNLYKRYSSESLLTLEEGKQYCDQFIERMIKLKVFL